MKIIIVPRHSLFGCYVLTSLVFLISFADGNCGNLENSETAWMYRKEKISPLQP